MEGVGEERNLEGGLRAFSLLTTPSQACPSPLSPSPSSCLLSPRAFSPPVQALLADSPGHGSLALCGPGLSPSQPSRRHQGQHVSPAPSVLATSPGSPWSYIPGTFYTVALHPADPASPIPLPPSHAQHTHTHTQVCAHSLLICLLGSHSLPQGHLLSKSSEFSDSLLSLALILLVS